MSRAINNEERREELNGEEIIAQGINQSVKWKRLIGLRCVWM